MTMNDELKPCPFCGSEPEVTYGSGTYVFIGCSNRECLFNPELPGYFPFEQAIKKWNTRAERTCHAVEYDDYHYRCSECGD